MALATTDDSLGPRLEIRRSQKPSDVRYVWSAEGDEPAPDAASGAVASEAVTWSPNAVLLHPEFSPDGTQLAVTVVASEARLAEPFADAGQLAIVDVEANGTVASARMVDCPVEGAFCSHPTWSPDGALLAYQVGWQADGSATEASVLFMTRLADGVAFELAVGSGLSIEAARDGGFGARRPRFVPSEWQEGYWLSYVSARNAGLTWQSDARLWLSVVQVTREGDVSRPPTLFPQGEGVNDVSWAATNGCLDEDVEAGCTICEGRRLCLVLSGEACECEAYWFD